MPTILGANTLSSGYDVANSVRFNNDDSAQLHKTPGGAGNQDAWTLSMWIKRSSVAQSGSQSLYGVYADGNNQETLAFDSGGNVYRLYWQFYQSGSVVGQLTTTRLFRDTSAWYHLVYSVDSTAGSNRTKIYINGDLISNNINLLELMTLNDLSTNNKIKTILPNWIDVNTSVNVKKLKFKSFESSNLTSKISFNNNILQLDSLETDLLNGNLKGDFYITEPLAENLKLSSNFIVEKINIRKSFDTFDNYGQTFIKKENLVLVTTEKDFFRLNKSQRKNIKFLKIKLEIKDKKNLEKILISKL